MKAELQTKIDAIIAHLRQVFAGLQAGLANTALVENINVEAYGTAVPLNTIANITCPDAKTVKIEPWDKGLVNEVEKTIAASNLGIMPQNMGDAIFLPIPPMTTERRQQLVKKMHQEAEKSRIAIRQLRHEEINHIRRQHKEGELSEDEMHQQEKTLQEQIDTADKNLTEMANNKEKEIANC